MLNETVISLLSKGLWETIYMTFASGFFGFAIGLPVGILLFLTKKGQLLENGIYNRILSVLVNIFRSIPFIILIVWMIPFTRSLVGTSIGMKGHADEGHIRIYSVQGKEAMVAHQVDQSHGAVKWRWVFATSQRPVPIVRPAEPGSDTQESYPD